MNNEQVQSEKEKKVYERGTIFYGKYAKGVPFLSKMVHKRVRVWTSGRASPYKTLLSTPHGVEKQKAWRGRLCQYNCRFTASKHHP